MCVCARVRVYVREGMLEKWYACTNSVCAYALRCVSVKMFIRSQINYIHLLVELSFAPWKSMMNAALLLPPKETYYRNGIFKNFEPSDLYQSSEPSAQG